MAINDAVLSLRVCFCILFGAAMFFGGITLFFNALKQKIFKIYADKLLVYSPLGRLKYCIMLEEITAWSEQTKHDEETGSYKILIISTQNTDLEIHSYQLFCWNYKYLKQVLTTDKPQKQL